MLGRERRDVNAGEKGVVRADEADFLCSWARCQVVPGTADSNCPLSNTSSTRMEVCCQGRAAAGEVDDQSASQKVSERTSVSLSPLILILPLLLR